MTQFLSDSLRLVCPQSHALLSRLVECTAATAARMNITARKEEAEIVFYHVSDSLSLLPLVRGAERVCDVGTGGGFPGLVLACLCPETEFVLMDATQKKVTAIASTAEKLGLTNVRALCARAEEAGRGAEREAFDVVVSRALAALPKLAELCLPLCRVGGVFYAMKGPRADEEIHSAEPILSRLRVGLPEKLPQVLDKEAFLALSAAPTEREREILDSFCEMERVILRFEKKTATPPSYPRPYAQICRGI